MPRRILVCAKCGSANLHKEFGEGNPNCDEKVNGKWIYYHCRDCSSERYVKYLPGMVIND